MSLFDEPLFTKEMNRVDLRPPPGSAYVHALNAEARSVPAAAWRSNCLTHGVEFVEILMQSRDEIVVSCPNLGLDDAYISLRDIGALMAFVGRLGITPYLDITGLSHSTWAPLIKASFMEKVALQVVYVEPADYTRSQTPAPGLIFDLSARIEGIAPLPGFASIRRSSRPENTCFIPLLGFEGARLGYTLDQVDPPDDKIVPIIGVPGFRPEYPFHTYSGNRAVLESNFLHAQVRFAKANCPFDAFHTLQRVARDFEKDFLRIAPIGTKPHGLGAILFALGRPDRVEIVYDHPVRQEKRTSGEARVCVYDVGAFLTSDLFLQRGDFVA